MIPRPDSFRFDPRWLRAAIGTDGANLNPASEGSCFSTPEALTNDPTEREFDEALEQVVAQECRLCPLCGLIVACDGWLTS
jgi:hypothetical protein